VNSSFSPLCGLKMLYRLRKRLNNVRFKLGTRGIYSTPPTPCDPAAACTIHTMLGHSELQMYLVAIKSFLRFQPFAQVAAHSDGSFTQNDAVLLRKHVPGIRVIGTTEADERASKALNPFLAEWRARDASWRRVIDTELWCETPRRMIIDSDILTIRKPEAVLDWIKGGGGMHPLMFGSTDPRPAGPIPEGTGKRHIQNIFRERLAQFANNAVGPPEFYQGGTSGYYGCTRELSLAEIERLIRAGLEAGIPMAEWGGEQCLVVYVLSTSDPIRLDVRKYFNFAPEAMDRLNEVAVAHFYGTFRFHGGVYQRLAAEVVRDLESIKT
jgi:hypothetical protein